MSSAKRWSSFSHSSASTASSIGSVYVETPLLHDLHRQIPQRHAHERDLVEQRLGAAVGLPGRHERERGSPRGPGEAELLDVVEGDGLEHAALLDVEEHHGGGLALGLGDHVAQHGARRRPGEVGDGGHAEAGLAEQPEVGEREARRQAGAENAQTDAVAALHGEELLVGGEGEGRPVRVRAGEAAQQVVARHVPHGHRVLHGGAGSAVPRQRVALVAAEEHALDVLVGEAAALGEGGAAVEHDALAVVGDHVGAERAPFDGRLRTGQVALTVVDQLWGRRVAPVHFHLVLVADEELIALEWVLQPRMHATSRSHWGK